jgi:hypothetical protein
MWKYIKDLCNDWIELENELAKQGIFRIYTIYGVIEYYDAPKQENKNENKKSTLV